MSEARTKPILAAALLAGWVLCWQPALPWGFAADDPDGRIGDIFVQRILVPAKNPEAWPRGNWEPLLRSELEQGLTGIVGPPDRARIERARYTAVLAGSSLTQGTLRWEIRQRNREPTWMVLDSRPLSLRWNKLDWEATDGTLSRPALCGTAGNGTLGLLVDRVQGAVVGDWSLPGKQNARTLEFDLGLPPADVSLLELTLPGDYVLSSSQGVVRVPKSAGDGTRVWTVELGGHRETRLTLRRGPDRTAARPLVLVEKSMAVALRRDVARIQAEFQVEILETALSELELALAPEIELLGISYGEGGALEWTAVDPAKPERIRIRLPETQSGRLPLLIVHCLARLHDVQTWTIPEVRLADADEFECRIALRLPAPQEIGDIRLNGFRQTEMTAHPADGETRLFRQIQPGGSVTITRSMSGAEYDCQSLSLIQTVAERLQCETEIRWTGRRGRVFAANCRIPDGWEVVDIRVPDPEDPGSQFDWSLATAGPSAGLLTVHFREPLESRMNRRMTVVAKRTMPLSPSELPLPVFAALDPIEADALIVVASSEQKTAVATESDDVGALRLDQVPDDWEPFRVWRDQRRNAAESPLVLKTRVRNPAAAITFRDRGASVVAPAPVPVATEATARVESPLVVESLDVEVTPSYGADSEDRYVAMYHVRGLSENREFRWRLDPVVELRSVSVGGVVVVSRKSGNDYTATVPPRTADPAGGLKEPSIVAIEYGVRAENAFWLRPRKMLLPAIDTDVGQFRFAVRLPHRLRLKQQPEGIAFPDFDEGASRRFGLLGPFSAPLEDLLSLIPGVPRSEFRNWQATADRVPGWIVLFLADADHRVVLCWCLLLGSALWRCFLKSWSASGLTLVTICISAACIGGIVWAPARWSDLFGSILAGNACAWLVPMRVLVRSDSETHSQIVPQGSTQSFAQLGALLICCFLVTPQKALTAQEKPGNATISVVPTPDSSKVIESVLIPTDDAGGAAGKSAFVYVSPAFAARLRQLADDSRIAVVPDYILSAASYSAEVREDQSVFVTAEFDVVILSPKGDVSVRVPLSGISVAGAEACRVDGAVQPVVSAAEGDGFVVQLRRESRGATDAAGDTEVSPEPTGSKFDESAPVTRRIQLKFFVPVEEADRLRIAEWHIPKIVRTQFSIVGHDRIKDARLIVKSSIAERAWEIQDVVRNGGFRCGPAGAVVLQWVRTSAAAAEVPAPTAAVSIVADLDPRLLLLTYQVDYQVPSGGVSSLVWNVPRGCSLRSVQAPDLLHHTMEVSGDVRRLVLEFSRPQKNAFSVSAVFAAERGPGVAPIRVPVESIGQSTLDGGRATVTLNQLALRTGADQVFEADIAQADAALRPRSIDEFIATARFAGPRPQQAFLIESSGDLPVMLKPRTIGLTASTEATVHVQHDRAAVIWQVEIEPHPIPVFHYRLRVDSQWRVENVSVHEDGVERVLRWSRSGDTLSVFLRDHSTARQLVFVEASRRLRLPDEFGIASIGIEEAASKTSLWTLFPDDDVDAAPLNVDGMPLPTEWPPGERGPGDLPGRRILVPEGTESIRIRAVPLRQEEIPAG